MTDVNPGAGVPEPLSFADDEGTIDFAAYSRACLAYEIGRLDPALPDYAAWPIDLPVGVWKAVASSPVAPAGSDGDYPDADGTDAAHPAWWRGHEHTTAVFCQKVGEILDGKDDGRGVSNEPWEAIRRRLIALAARGQPPAGEAVIGEEGEVYTAAHLKRLLDGRDGFIVNQGLWPAFCDQCDTAHPAEPAAPDGDEQTRDAALNAGKKLNGWVSDALQRAVAPPDGGERERLIVALHEGLGGSGWAYSNYGGQELRDMRHALEGGLDAILSALRPAEGLGRLRAEEHGSSAAPIPTEQADGPVVDRMVDRFLSWKLPDTFCPDGGVAFDKARVHPNHWPTGTNLLDHTQATAMVRHMLEGDAQ